MCVNLCMCQVLPGTCAVSQCPFQSLPYGLNYYGAFVQVLSTSFAYEKTIFYGNKTKTKILLSVVVTFLVNNNKNVCCECSVPVVAVLTSGTPTALRGVRPGRTGELRRQPHGRHVVADHRQSHTRF